jgi:DNA-binding transcriptional MerR regulator
MYFPDRRIELLERQYFSISRAAKVTGLAPTVIRYWGSRSARMDALKRHANNQRRFLAHQVVHILAVRVATEELGMSLDGAIELMEGADVERFLSGKRKRGEAVLTKDHLKELITNQLSFTLQRVFGDEGKKVISLGTGAGTAFSRGRVEPPELAAA